jgi:hypothetical protein
MKKDQIRKIIERGECNEENFEALCDFIKPYIFKVGERPDEELLLQHIINFVKRQLDSESVNLEKINVEFKTFMQYYEENDWCSGSGKNKKPITNWKICASNWFSSKVFRFKIYDNRPKEQQAYVGNLK